MWKKIRKSKCMCVYRVGGRLYENISPGEKNSDREWLKLREVSAVGEFEGYKRDSRESENRV